VEQVKKNLPKFQAVLPDDVSVSYQFDQSYFVKRSIHNLTLEGLLGALLAAPVSGNAKVVKAGKLSIVASGPREAFDTALPYLEALVRDGVDGALRADPGLADGVYLYRGKLVHSPTAASFGLEATSLAAAMGDRR